MTTPSGILNPASVFGVLRPALPCTITLNAGRLRLILTVCMLIAVLSLALVPPPCEAQGKVYLDITSPGVRKLPIAIQPFTNGREISTVVRDDLTMTGLFECIDDAAQIERPDQPFLADRWRGLGVDLVVKGTVARGKGLTVVVSAFDVSEQREVLKKEYSGSAEAQRTIGHSVANDIYKLLTGRQGVFRTRMAYVTERGAKKEIALMDWDGHRSQGIGLTGGIMLTPRWSPDGSRLLYAAERNRRWNIYVLDLGTLKERELVILQGLNMSGNFFPDGREFVFTSSKDGRHGIYIGDATSMKGRNIISSPWIDVSPAVSPDGRTILFASNRSGSPQIYSADRNGEMIKRLTFEGSNNTSPVWSPKGDRIAYVSLIGGRKQIYVMKPDGSGVARLTDRGNNEDPTFSPDGRFIAFTSDRDGAKGIYVMVVNGEGQKRVTPRNVRATRPSWSPF